MDGNVVREVHLVDTAKEAQEIAQAGPVAFNGISMNFAKTIAIIITRPLPLPKGMADPDMDSPGVGQRVIRFPFVGIDGAAGLGVRDHKRHQGGAIAMMAHVQPDLSTFAPEYPSNGWAIVVPCAMPRPGIGAASLRGGTRGQTLRTVVQGGPPA